MFHRRFTRMASENEDHGVESVLTCQGTDNSGGLLNPLDCLQCKSPIKCPVRLPCQHHFCRLCIINEKCCAICARPIGCSELVEDKVLSYVLESSREVTETCANCDQISQPMFFCDTCHQPLCSACREITHKAKIFSTHHILELEERGRLRSRPVCPLHNEPFILFCLDSKSLMCIECFNSSSLEQRGHFVNIDVAHKICCDKLEKNAANLRIFQEELCEQMELRKRLIDEIGKNGDHLSVEIDQKCDAVIGRVNELRQRLLTRVGEERAEKQRQLKAQLAKLATLGSPISVNLLSVSIFCSYASKMDVLHCYADLHKSIQQFLSSNGRQLIEKVKFGCNFNIDFSAEFAQSICQQYLGLSLALADNSTAHGIFLSCDPTTSRSSANEHTCHQMIPTHHQRNGQSLDELPIVEDPGPTNAGSPSVSSSLSKDATIIFSPVDNLSSTADDEGSSSVVIHKLADDLATANAFPPTAPSQMDAVMNANGPMLVADNDQSFSEYFKKIALPLNEFAFEISALSRTLLDLQRDLTLRRCVVSPEELLSKITNCEEAWKRLELHNKQVESIVHHHLKQFWRREIERTQRQQLAVREKARELVQLRSLAKRALKVSQQLKPFAAQMAALISVIDARRRSDAVVPSPMEQICMQIAKMEPDSESRVAAIEKEETLRREAKREEQRAQMDEREALRAKKALREVRPPTPKMRVAHHQFVTETDRDRATDSLLIREGGGGGTHSCLSSPLTAKKPNRRMHRNSEGNKAPAENLQKNEEVNSLIANFYDETEELSAQSSKTTMPIQKGTQTNGNALHKEGQNDGMGREEAKQMLKRASTKETEGESSKTITTTETDGKSNGQSADVGRGEERVKTTPSQKTQPMPTSAVTTQMMAHGRDPGLLQVREKLLEAIREKVKRVE